MTLTRGSRASTLIVGLLLMLLAVMGAVATVQPALGQEAPVGEDDDAESEEGGDAEREAIEVVESAVYAHPVTDSPPETVTSSVPPQAVCVVAPELCPEEAGTVTDPLEDGIASGQDEAPVSPVQPIPPETVAVSYFAGKNRYESALKLELPQVPEGEEVTSFQLHVPVAQPSGDLSSPAFRDVITSVFLTISDQDPAAFAERLAEALQSDPISTENDYLQMEACALTKPFEPSEAPQAQHRDDIPRDEPFEEGELGPVATDCLLGGTGTLDEEGEHWVFDLTFAVDAWASGEAENHGVLISPAGVPNLAFGDPDSSTFSQATLDHTQATAAFETAEPPPPIEPMDAPPMAESGGGEAQPPETGSDFDDAPAPSDSGDGGLDDPAVADDPEMGDEPAASEPVDEPAVASPDQQQATPAASGPSPSPWTWLLVPVFAGGAWLVTRSLTAPVAAAAGGGAGNGGAMSRLIASRGGASTA